MSFYVYSQLLCFSFLDLVVAGVVVQLDLLVPDPVPIGVILRPVLKTIYHQHPVIVTIIVVLRTFDQNQIGEQPESGGKKSEGTPRVFYPSSTSMVTPLFSYSLVEMMVLVV